MSNILNLIEKRKREKCNNLIMKVQTKVTELREIFLQEESQNNLQECSAKIASIIKELEKITKMKTDFYDFKSFQRERSQFQDREVSRSQNIERMLRDLPRFLNDLNHQ